MTDQTDGGTPAQQAAAKAVARGFRDKVKKLVESSGDRATLFEALRNYQQNMEVEQLVDTLSLVLNHPDRLPLFHDIRMMIPPRHHLTYNSMVPPPPSNSMRVVTLKRHGKEGFGFGIRGGKEHNCGMFISSVRPGSAASTAQLKIGEQLVSVDGYPVSELIHEEVLNMLRGARGLKLRLKAVCMLPYQNDGDDAIHWQLIGADGKPHAVSDGHGDEDDNEEAAAPSLGVLGPGERRVTITKDGKPLDCGILGGNQSSKKGIFVTSVLENGLAHQSGLKNNDQIILVNGVSLEDIKHSDAIRVFKSSNVLVMTVRSEKYREEQEEWERQMVEKRQRRMQEFAEARPSDDQKAPFYISPPLKDNPLMAQTASAMKNLYSQSSGVDDDLGEIDVYSTDNKLSSSSSDDDDDSSSDEAAALANPPKSAGISNEDDLAVSDVVQSHLQRLYIDQQRERHTRMNKSNQQRQDLLQEVRKMRKTSKEQPAAEPAQASSEETAGKKEESTAKHQSGKDSAEPTVTTVAGSLKKKPAETSTDSATKEQVEPSPKTAGQEKRESSTEVHTVVKKTSVTVATASATGSMRSTRSEALYDEVKLVSFPATFALEKSNSVIRTGAVTQVGEVAVAQPTGDRTSAVQGVEAPAVPAAFADDPPALPSRNSTRTTPLSEGGDTATNAAKQETGSGGGPTVTDGAVHSRQQQQQQPEATKAEPPQPQESQSARRDSGEKDEKGEKRVAYTKVEVQPSKKATAKASSDTAAATGSGREQPPSKDSKAKDSKAKVISAVTDGKPIPSPKPALKAKPVPSPKTEVRAKAFPSPKPELKAKPMPSPKPELKAKPVSSPKPEKKLELAEDPVKKTPYSAVKVVATAETARHSPPPPGADLPKVSALKGAKSEDAAKKMIKKGMKKQASFAVDVECVVIKPPVSKHADSMLAEDFDDVNPSNLEFGEDVLQGRRAEFHSIPKSGPLGIKLRGGHGTSAGGKIFIAGITPEGSVGQYGHLHKGDQILMVDGTSFVEISQRDATQALHEAMQWETECIDIVVATEHQEGGD